jgi:hypothetical protein
MVCGIQNTVRWPAGPLFLLSVPKITTVVAVQYLVEEPDQTGILADFFRRDGGFAGNCREYFPAADVGKPPFISRAQ